MGTENMYKLLTLIYLINATLLIVHEIDSAYWEEWKLFGLPGGARALSLNFLHYLNTLRLRLRWTKGWCARVNGILGFF